MPAVEGTVSEGAERPPSQGADSTEPQPRGPSDLAQELRQQLAEHAEILQDTVQMLLEQRDSALLLELASLRDHHRELRNAISAARADQQFTREVAEQCLQTAIAQRDAELRLAITTLKEQQATLQETVRELLEGHIARWRAEVDALCQRLDRSVAAEAAQREAALALLSEQVTTLREYQHDRDLRTEALLTEIARRTGSGLPGAPGWWARLCERVREWYWSLRGR